MIFISLLNKASIYKMTYELLTIILNFGVLYQDINTKEAILVH
jgi:hypothetical protein